MFEHYQVANVGSKGLVALEDENRFRLSPDAWTTAHNVRFSGNSALPARGWSPECVVAGGAERTQWSYVVGYGGVWWIAFAETGIYTVMTPYEEPANTVRNISPVDFALHSNDESFWSITDFQGIPVATNGIDLPVAQFQAGVTAGIPAPRTPFVSLPGFPDSARPKHIISHKGFLIAANFSDDGSGIEFPNLIMWSDVAEPGDLPDNWDYTDPESLAGRQPLPAGAGPITNVKLLNDAVYLFTATTAYRLSYVGGQFIWKLERVSGEVGAFGPFSIAELPHSLITMTQDDVRIFDGIRSDSIANDRVRNALISSITDETDKRDVVCSTYTSEQEVWIMVRSEAAMDDQIELWDGLDPREITWDDMAAVTWSSAEDHIWDEGVANANNLAWVFNFADGTWATRDVPYLSYAVYMPEQIEVSIFATITTWDEVRRHPDIDRWDKWYDTPWNVGAITSPFSAYHLYAVSARDNALYRLDNGWDHNWIPNYYPTLERVAINLGGDELTQFARAVYPQMDVGAFVASKTPNVWDEMSTDAWDEMSTDTWDDFAPDHVAVTIRVGSQDTAHADPSYRTGKTFELGDYRVTTRCRGRRHALQITSGREDWRLGGYDIEFEQSGRR